MSENDRRIRANFVKDLSVQHTRLADDVVRLLYEKYKATGDVHDRDALVLHLMPMVMMLVSELQVPYQFSDDVVQAGNIAILESLASSEWRGDSALSTYLYPSIRRDMLRELEFLQGEGGMPHDWSQVDQEQHETFDDKDEFQPRAYVQAEGVCNNNNEDLENVVLAQQLRKAINVLDEPDRAVMLLLAEDKSHQAIADLLRIPRRTVSHIVERATVRLHSILR